MEFIAAQTGDVFVRVSPGGTLEYISGSVRAALGYEPEQLIGTDGLDLVHPDDRETFIENTRSALKGERKSAHERVHRFRSASGAWVWMEGNPRVVRDRRGRVVEMVNVFRDVSERKRSEAHAVVQAQMFRSAFDHAAVGKALVGLDGRFLDINTAFCELLGYPKAVMLALDFQTITHPDDLDADLSLLDELNRGDIPSYRMDKRYLRADGSVVWVHLTVTAMRDAAGAPQFYISQVQDQTDRRAAEDELRRKTVEAEAAAAAKAEFLANMSHEIRTPLTAILGFTSLLAERPELSGAAQGQVDRISAAGRSLLAIVNDILDFSKLEAGEMVLKPRPTSPTEIARDTLDLFQAQAEAKGLALSLEAGADLPAHVLVDPDRTRQILVNLVGNAVKFTETGGVTGALAYEAGAERLAIEVRDSGAGMTKGEQAKLFQRFSQVDGSTTRRHGGTGLGLAICRALVAAMGGEIGVTSAPGHGSTFRFWAPAPRADAEAPLAAEDEGVSLEGVRVLVVDDNPVNRELARVFLEALGVAVTTAEDGARGLEKAATT